MFTLGNKWIEGGLAALAAILCSFEVCIGNSIRFLHSVFQVLVVLFSMVLVDHMCFRF